VAEKMMRYLPSFCQIEMGKSGIVKDDEEAVESYLREHAHIACEIILHGAIECILPKIALEPPEEISKDSDIYFTYEYKGIKFAVTADWHCLDLRAKVWAWFDVGES
jgi:hypothetical protein